MQLNQSKTIENVEKKKFNNAQSAKFVRKSNQSTFLDKRSKKRKNTLDRFRQRVLENMLIIKKGTKITRRFQKSASELKNLGSQMSRFSSNNRQGKNAKKFSGRLNSYTSKTMTTKLNTKGSDFSNLSGACKYFAIL